MDFSNHFVWGAAASSYQIEGGSREGGKGDSVWDEFCRIPGAVFEGQTGDIACDHYHRFRDDIAMMKQLGIRAYRFSFSWPRIFPNGTGEINEDGMRFYEDVVEELLKNEIIPYATLFHWDYPAVLQKQGGWLNPQSPLWFEQYAEAIAKRFQGKIHHYFTINEPQCFIGLGYGRGQHAPGLKLSAADNFLAVHHVLLAHGRAVRALRKYGGPVSVGLAQCGRIYSPQSNLAEDTEAARRATFEVPDNFLDALFSVSLWSDPIFKGEYPQDFRQKFSGLLPKISAEDMEIISQPIDFYAQNIYHSTRVKATKEGWEEVPFPPGMTKTAMNWPVTPECLYWCPKFLYEKYHKKIIISENGMSAHDTISLDGRVHDPNRIDYLRRYLSYLRKAAREDIDIGGYFIWSLMDNFEWDSGYHERFGIIYIDYETQQRIPKDSAYWYQKVVECNGEKL
ncbi:GH1 family beta-glucosidase [Caproiciproducens faecalis]|uniref:Beta-glucosidase n=1 Tax=Caproiciproducens faecalis TaxID=2820301 RepID=A0ABS7DM38_9FIRM|nr:GH1 family beta-glucosidase [Caproiciproducens faecalis]MBW7572132.1 beta-glucosidase [Caproiciproducens faecalis]